MSKRLLNILPMLAQMAEFKGLMSMRHAAVLIKGGSIIGVGVNKIRRDEPWHAEKEAIRDAMRRSGLVPFVGESWHSILRREKGKERFAQEAECA